MLFELGKLYNYMKYENNIYIAFQKKKKKLVIISSKSIVKFNMFFDFR